MEIETRMGFRVRSKYEDVVAWIQSDPPGVPYPKNRKHLQAMDSHVYAQLTASLSNEATRTVADDFYRNRGDGGYGGAAAEAPADRLDHQETKETKETKAIEASADGLVQALKANEALQALQAQDIR